MLDGFLVMLGNLFVVPCRFLMMLLLSLITTFRLFLCHFFSEQKIKLISMSLWMTHNSMVGDCQKLFCAIAYIGGTATIPLFFGHKVTAL